MHADRPPSSLPTLRDLYAAHTGKVSDKWSLYLDIYDSAFTRFRDRPITFVEIGVQNGGSLELWARYFARAEALVGCDIDPKCGDLTFDDARVSVIVGDVNQEATYQAMRKRAPACDVFVDDGSHTSRDIIATFCRYFRHVKPGGLYVIEDLHCSYMPDWGGGAGRRDTSMEFLKLLAEWVNLPNWQASRSPASLLDAFFPEGPRPDLAPFLGVWSVAFFDSMCLVEKRATGAIMGLGDRVIVGNDAQVSADPVNYRNGR